jgi:hypothetical protein
VGLLKIKTFCCLGPSILEMFPIIVKNYTSIKEDLNGVLCFVKNLRAAMLARELGLDLRPTAGLPVVLGLLKAGRLSGRLRRGAAS